LPSWEGNLQEDTENILTSFADYMFKYQIKVAGEYLDSYRTIITSILSPDNMDMLVVPAIMGSGKSTLLKVLVRYMTRKYHDFGCIIAKERVEDFADVIDFIGYADEDYGDGILTSQLVGFRPELCRKRYSEFNRQCVNCDALDCKIRRGYAIQRYHQVLVETQQRLFFQAESGRGMDSLRAFIVLNSGKEHVYKRQYVFIDEQPKFFSSYKVGYKDLYEFVGVIAQIEKKTGDYFKSDKILQFIKELLDREEIDEDINKLVETCKHIEGENFYTVDVKEILRKEIENKRRKKAYLLDVRNTEILINLERFRKYWWRYFEGQHPEMLNIFVSLFKGEVIKTWKNTVYVPITASYSFDGLKTVVFDGTAYGDMTYPSSVQMVKMPDLRYYSNVTINHCPETNMSWSKVSNSKIENGKKVIFEKLSPEIRRIANTGKTLIVTHKDHKEYLKLSIGHMDNIEVDHFNNLKGKNEYLNCTNVIFATTLHKGDPFYILKGLYLDRNKVKSLKSRNGNGHYLECSFLREVQRNDQEKYILQDIFRVALRSSTNDIPVNIYLFCRDKKLIERVREAIPGSNIKLWFPEFLDDGKFLEFKFLLKERLVNPGDYIAKKEVRKLLDNMDSSYFRQEFMRKEKVISWLEDNSILVMHHKFIKA